MADQHSAHRFDFLPWEFRHSATDEQKADQKERQIELAGSGEATFGDEVYVARSAGVFCSRLVLGDRVYIGANAYVTGDVEAGAGSTINPFAVVRGRVALGQAVRVGAHSSLLGFNHGFAPDRPVFTQPHTSRGIIVGDDVWIGSNVTVLDGVCVGAHAVIGAGAVVTRDVPDWGVAVGNPARIVRDRRDAQSARPTVAAPVSTRFDLADRLAGFANRARDQVGDVLARAYDGERFLAGRDSRRPSVPGAMPSRSATCSVGGHRINTTRPTWSPGYARARTLRPALLRRMTSPIMASPPASPIPPRCLPSTAPRPTTSSVWVTHYSFSARVSLTPSPPWRRSMPPNSNAGWTPCRGAIGPGARATRSTVSRQRACAI